MHCCGSDLGLPSCGDTDINTESVIGKLEKYTSKMHFVVLY